MEILNITFMVTLYNKHIKFLVKSVGSISKYPCIYLSLRFLRRFKMGRTVIKGFFVFYKKKKQLNPK